MQHVLFGSILSIAPAAEIKFLPPGGDMPASKKMPYPSRIPGTVIPGISTNAIRSVPGDLSLVGKLPKSLDTKPLADPCSDNTSKCHPSMDPVLQDVLDVNNRHVEGTCVGERHPAMSPLDTLPPNFSSPSKSCAEVQVAQVSISSNILTAECTESK